MNKLVGVLSAMWLGMQICVGYMVAPILFQRMTKMEAGEMAGSLFNVVGYSGLIIWVVIYFIGRHELNRSLLRTQTNKFVALLILLLAANQFLITPVIEAFKANRSNWLSSLLGGSFGTWHGTSSIVYMLCSLIALGLVFRLVKMDWH